MLEEFSSGSSDKSDNDNRAAPQASKPDVSDQGETLEKDKQMPMITVGTDK
jgi:hypothetical protein